MFINLMEGNEEDCTRLLSMVSSDKARDSGHIFKHMKLCLNTRKWCSWCGGGGELNSPIDEAKSSLLKLLRSLMNMDDSIAFRSLS